MSSAKVWAIIMSLLGLPPDAPGTTYTGYLSCDYGSPSAPLGCAPAGYVFGTREGISLPVCLALKETAMARWGLPGDCF